MTESKSCSCAIRYTDPSDPDSWSVVGACGVSPFRFASHADALVAAAWMTKNTETIVRECAQLCTSYVWFEDGDRGPDESNEGCAAAILEAYGLK